MRTKLFILLFATALFSVNSQVITEGYGFYEEPYMGINLPNRSVTDSEGNTYVTGTSSDEDSPQGNIFTVKFNKEGEIEWKAREATVDFVVEFGWAITLDENDNPVVSGSYWNGENMDMKTIKYNKDSGTVVWSAIFDSGHNALDYPKSVTTDLQGNVIVAGHSLYDENSIGYSVVKYDSQGNQLWSDVLENEFSATSSLPVKIVSDADGNLGITGTDADATGKRRYYTVKYSENGDLLWKKNYSFDSPYNSLATDTTFDEYGNLYVTGTFGRGDFENNKIGTIKYAPNGEVEWINGYESAENTLIGGQVKVTGNMVYVAGIYYDLNIFTEGSILIAYSEGGNESWVQRTADMVAGDVKLELDADLNPVLATYGMTPDWQNFLIRFHKYSESGDLLDEKNLQRDNSNGMLSIDAIVGFGIDSENDLFVTLYARYMEEGNVYEVSKFTETGSEPEWINYYGNFGGGDATMVHSQKDNSGNTIVCGKFGAFDENSQFFINYFLAKYDISDQIIWKTNFLESNESEPVIKTNSLGETITLFYSSMTSKATVQKYSSAGELVWQYEKSLINPYFNQLVVDENDNIYIAGISYYQNTPRYSLIKISDQGNEVWEKHMDINIESTENEITTIKFDLNGNINLFGTFGHYQQISGILYSFSATGDENYATPIMVNEKNLKGVDLEFDQDNNIYTLSQVKTVGQYYSGTSLITKLDPMGNILWNKVHEETESNLVPNKIISLPNNEFAIIISNFVLDEARNKLTIIKYDSEGNQLNVFNSEYDRFYRDSYSDILGNIYVLNQAEHQTAFPHRESYLQYNTLIQASVLKIDTDDNLDELIFQGPNLSMFYPSKFLPHTDGRLQISGTLFHEVYSFMGLYFFETTHETLGVDDPILENAEMNYLGQNYPNPASDYTTIPFKIKETGNVSLVLYDASGKYIRNLFNGNLSKGNQTVTVNVSGLSKGIYFYQFSSRNFKASKKMIIK